MTSRSEKTLPVGANLENLKKQAKQLLHQVQDGKPGAAARFALAMPRRERAGGDDRRTLSDAQLVIAREYGFASWPKLKAAVEARRSSPAATDSGSAHVTIPLLPLRDLVVSPGMRAPIFVGRPRSFQAVEAAADDQRLFLCLQRQSTIEEPAADDLYPTGTIAAIIHTKRFGDGTVQLTVEGRQAARALKIDWSQGHGMATAEILGDASAETKPERVEQARRLFLAVACALDMPPQLSRSLRDAETPAHLTGLASQYLVGLQNQQSLLGITDPSERLNRVVDDVRLLQAAITAPPLEDYVGSYEMAPGFVVEVQTEDGRLVAASPWDRSPVLPFGQDSFSARAEHRPDRELDSLPLHLAMPTRNRAAPLLYRFHREGGRVTGVSRTENGETAWPMGRKLGAGDTLAAPMALPAAKLRRYAGEYELRPGLATRVTAEARGLFLNSAKLLPISETEFFAVAEPVRVTFKHNASKHVLGMSLRGKRMNGQYWKIT